MRTRARRGRERALGGKHHARPSSSIPKSLKLAISAGIGLYLAFIVLQNAAIVVDHPVTPVTMGDPASAPAALALLGFFVILALHHRRIPGAVVQGILLVTAIGVATGGAPWKGIAAISMPLTVSIAHGIGLGFIAYATIKKLFSGSPRECRVAVTVIAVLFAAQFAFL